MSNKDDNYYANIKNAFEDSYEAPWEQVCHKKSKNSRQSPLFQQNTNRDFSNLRSTQNSPVNNKTKISPKVNHKVTPKVEVNVQAKVEPKVAVNAQPKVKVAVNVQPKVTPKVEPKVAVKIEPKVAVKIEPKVADKVESKVESTKVSHEEIEKELLNNQQVFVEEKLPSVTSKVEFTPNTNYSFEELIKMIVLNPEKILTLIDYTNNIDQQIRKIQSIKEAINTVLIGGLFSSTFPNELTASDLSICEEIINYISTTTNQTTNTSVEEYNFLPIESVELPIELPPVIPPVVLPVQTPVQLQQHKLLMPPIAQQVQPQVQPPPYQYQPSVQQYQQSVQQYQVPPHHVAHHQQYQVPTHQQYQVSAHQQYQVPAHQQYQVPAHQQYQAPAHQQYQVPTHQQYQVPTHQQYQVPTHQQYQAPTQQYQATTQQQGIPSSYTQSLSYEQPSSKIYQPPFRRQNSPNIETTQTTTQQTTTQQNTPLPTTESPKLGNLYYSSETGIYNLGNSIWSTK